jgi:hypothetical protein
MSERAADRLLLFAGAAIAGVAALLGVNFDTDTFFYLAAGDWVLANGALPGADPLAYASVDDRWLLHFPLCQVGFAAIVRAVDLGGLAAVGAALATLALVAWWWPLGRDRQARVLAAAPLALAVAFEPTFFAVRGQLVGHLLLGLALPSMLRLRDGDNPPAWFPLVVAALWVNSHPSFLLLLALPALFLLTDLLSTPVPGSARATLRFVGLAALGACLTPYGPLLPLDHLALFTHFGARFIDLFQPADLGSPAWLALFAGLAAAAAWRASADDERSASDALALLVLTALALYSRRYVYLPLLFVSVLLRTRALPGLVVPGARATRVATTLVALALFAGATLTERRELLSRVPAAGARAIEATGRVGPVLNPYPWGGYLEWRWRGERPVFIDERNNLFAPEVLHDYLRLKYAAPGFEEILDVYAFDVVLWPVDRPLDRALSGAAGWTQAYRDAQSVVYLRR